MSPRGVIVVTLLSALAVIASHVTVLSTPYFWDEVGQFVPATSDLFEHGRIVPQSATPNVHPPLVPAWVALWWRVLGCSIAVSRLTMLVLATLALAASYLLARQLAEPPAAALAAVLLAISPLFYAQSMLVQLDLPAMLWTAAAMALFFSGRHAAAIAACMILVWTKETGALLPLLCAAWLARERRWKAALGYMLPLVALAAWLAILKQESGHWLGNAAFADYNLSYPLHLGRLALAMLRRAWYLFIDQAHWAGVAALFLAARPAFRNERWRFAILFAGLHTLAVCLLGGAVLERYLLPVIPILYTAFAAALMSLPSLRRAWLTGVLAAGLLLGHFMNPLLYPFPYENNQAFLDFTFLHRSAARWLEQNVRGPRILTAWPATAELSDPRFGYVRQPFVPVEAPGLDEAGLRSFDGDDFDAVVVFSKEWEPPLNWGRKLAEFAGYRVPATPGWISRHFGKQRAIRLKRGGQWVDVYLKSR